MEHFRVKVCDKRRSVGVYIFIGAPGSVGLVKSEINDTILNSMQVVQSSSRLNDLHFGAELVLQSLRYLIAQLVVVATRRPAAITTFAGTLVDAWYRSTPVIKATTIPKMRRDLMCLIDRWMLPI